MIYPLKSNNRPVAIESTIHLSEKIWSSHRDRERERVHHSTVVDQYRSDRGFEVVGREDAKSVFVHFGSGSGSKRGEMDRMSKRNMTDE